MRGLKLNVGEKLGDRKKEEKQGADTRVGVGLSLMEREKKLLERGKSFLRRGDAILTSEY